MCWTLVWAINMEGDFESNISVDLVISTLFIFSEITMDLVTSFWYNNRDHFSTIKCS
jgi:hypothetical protein